MAGPGTEVARLLMVAIRQARHYGLNHPTARAAIEQFAARVQAELAQMQALRLEVGGEWLTVQGIVLPAEDRHAGGLREHLADRRVENLVIREGTPRDAFVTLVRLLALEPEGLIAEGGIAEALEAANVTGIAANTSDAAAAPEQAKAGAYAEAIVIAGELWAQAERGGPVDVARAHVGVRGIADALTGDRLRVVGQAAYRGHDELDPAHAVNTATFCLLLSEALGLSTEIAVEASIAALLHDIGMAALPWEQQVRERTSAAVQSSWRHPVEGGYLLRHVGGRGSLPMVVVLEHHLPALGEGASVLPLSRLVSLIDYVDAQTCGRVPALRRGTIGSILGQLLGGEGPQFDPRHVRALAAVVQQAAAGGAEFSG